jgi:hypothetical protein
MPKLNKTQQRLLKLFNSEIGDKELYERTVRFNDGRESYRELYNGHVKEYNELVEKYDVLKEGVMSAAVGGVNPEHIVSEFIAVKKKLAEKAKCIEVTKHEMNENDRLLKQYRDSSERSFFIWWKILSEAGVINESWSNWFPKYKDKII